MVQPEMSVGLRISLTGELADPSKVSKVFAQYLVHGEGKDSIAETGGACTNLKLGTRPLWQGGLFSSAPLSLVRERSEESNKPDPGDGQ